MERLHPGVDGTRVRRAADQTTAGASATATRSIATWSAVTSITRTSTCWPASTRSSNRASRIPTSSRSWASAPARTSSTSSSRSPTVQGGRRVRRRLQLDLDVRADRPARQPDAVVWRHAVAEERADRKYWDQSPLKHVANVKTPTLFLVGENNTRVRVGPGAGNAPRAQGQRCPDRARRRAAGAASWFEPRHQLYKGNVELEWIERYVMGRRVCLAIVAAPLTQTG